MLLFDRASRLALLLTALPLLAASSAAMAQVPSAGEAACILSWNKAAGGVSKASAGAIGACVMAAIKGKESAPQACTTADAKGKIAKATDTLEAVTTGACADGAPFGFAGLVSSSPAATVAPREVAASLFGDDLDAGIFVVGSEASACQSAMLKAAQGTLSASFKEFSACKKAQLAAGSLASAAQLEAACFQAINTDAKGKVAKARAKIDAAGNGPCSGGVAAGALPGDCAAAPAAATCVDSRVRCALCRMIDGVDGLSRDCDDWDDSTINGSCSTCGNGVLEAGEVCDDGEANGEGCCSTTCSAANAGSACDDGDECTIGDICVSGACVGVAPDCSGLDSACTVGVCNASTGDCEAAPANNGASCNDGDLCTTGDICSAGTCAGATVDCNAFDGACTEGTCNAGTGDCEAAPANNGASCDDGDLCTTSDTCSAGTCAGATIDCSSFDSACTAGTCNAGTGLCEALPANEGLSCDDGDACTDADACTAGVCTGSPVPPSSVVLEDDFPGTSLHPDWQVAPSGVATAAVYTVHDSLLEFTDIINSTTNEWGSVRFERPIPATGDLRATFQVNWDSGGSNSPIQYMRVDLLDADGANIASAYYNDSWAANSGNLIGCDNAACSGTGQGTIPLTGSQIFTIERIDSDLTIEAGATTLRSSTTIATAATRVRIETGFWHWSGGNFFGTTSSDLVKVESLNTACAMP